MSGTKQIDASHMRTVAGLKPSHLEYWEKDSKFRVFVCIVDGVERRIRFDIEKRGSNNYMLPLDRLDDAVHQAALQLMIPELHALVFSEP